MIARTPADARLLMVVSRNHGDLGLAMSFVRGQALAARATLLLPDDLHALHADSLPVPAHPYASPGDVLGAVARHEPDLVLLCSGYLLAIERLLSAGALNTLRRRLDERGGRVATSDPFLGLLSHVTVADMDTRMLAPGHPPHVRWLTRVLVRLRGKIGVPALQDMAHLHPLAVPEADDGIARFAFFNPEVMAGAGGSTPPAEGDRPGWLFVLSANDLHAQHVLHGRQDFTEHLLGMLRYAVEVESRPTLIAPPTVVDRLRAVLPGTIELLPACPLAEFERRLLDAQYLFTWSAFSFPHLLRLARGLPAFLFDRGYYGRTIAPFYDAARACYVPDAEPTFMDQQQIFSPYVLAHLAKTQHAQLQASRARWRASPTPDAVVDRLLGGGVAPGPA